jgi:hypothetical protein
MNEIINTLGMIISDKINRTKLIKEFQQKVWNEELDVNENVRNTLLELAYDMDFYEPNEALRAEDLSYYDDIKLENEIQSALKKLRSTQ